MRLHTCLPLILQSAPFSHTDTGSTFKLPLRNRLPVVPSASSSSSSWRERDIEQGISSDSGDDEDETADSQLFAREHWKTPQPDGGDEDQDEAKVILSLTMRGKQLGAASYDADSGKLLLLEDAPAGGSALGLEQAFLDDRIGSLASRQSTSRGVEEDSKQSKEGDLIQLRERGLPYRPHIRSLVH